RGLAGPACARFRRVGRVPVGPDRDSGAPEPFGPDPKAFCGRRSRSGPEEARFSGVKAVPARPEGRSTRRRAAGPGGNLFHARGARPFPAGARRTRARRGPGGRGNVIEPLGAAWRVPLAPVDREKGSPRGRGSCRVPLTMATVETIEAFKRKWIGSEAAERSNSQLFLTELTDLMGVPHPTPAVNDASADHYDMPRRARGVMALR